MKKVLIPTKLNKIAKELLEETGRYEVVQDESENLPELAAAHPDAYALLVRSNPVDAAIFDALPSLKVVIRAGAGYNTIDVKEARSRGIDVMNTPGANSNAVAEEVVAMILADIRHIVAGDPSVRSGKWEKKKFMGRELTGKTVGILGLGSIGKLLVKRLSGFEVRCLGYDPLISEELAREIGVELVDLHELFAQSDFISLHIPENEHTRGMINQGLLGRMKEGATLINCARAGVINEDDVKAAREEKGVRFLNDVYPEDAEGEKSVAEVADLVLPHLGASTQEANTNAARRAAVQLIEFDEKGVTSYIVNRDIPDGLDEAYSDLTYTLTQLCRRMAGMENNLEKIETSFYGKLKPFADWLVVPVVVALNDDFDRSLDCQAALQYLKDRGVDYECREPDDNKGYLNSITVDLVVRTEPGSYHRASVRGTVAEGVNMVSRIDFFDKLYFEPQGHTAFFVYPDRPGVLGEIGSAFAEADINIDDIRQPHDEDGKDSIAILKVNKCVSDDILHKIKTQIDARAAFCMEFKR